jgi:hypothetical protein
LTLNYSITNTDTVVFDLAKKVVTLNGTSARNLLAANSQWFGAAAGVSNYTFAATNTVTGTTSASVTYSSAYI